MEAVLDLAVTPIHWSTLTNLAGIEAGQRFRVLGAMLNRMHQQMLQNKCNSVLD